tara:strand:+ start:543 stop:959 length:417 start_codon:yes stop_codon:yes gene_type:complete
MAKENTGVTASITLEVELEQLPAMIRSLLAQEGQRLVDLVNAYNNDIILPLQDKAEDNDGPDLPLAIENVDDLRRTLARVDSQLAQYHNLLKGYYQQKNASLMPETAEDLAEKMQTASKFNEFVNRIPTEVEEEDESS